MESLSDIVAEMRTRSREVKEAFGGRPDGVENMLDIWAGRIEAAAKREVVSKKETTPVGNAAAMREALANIAEYAQTARCHTEDAHVLSYLDQIECWARAALSAPARNCDKMPDIDNLTMHDLANSPCKSTLENASREELLALVRWLLAPAAERKGEDYGK